ncbi:MAG TPA: hypothetical protein VJS92_09215 [Candidatus Polarisedimenticolaceae bacterium]|nr:hypothetical protein [Candidatus Polarisedimenticolaceae bacterium]
MKLASKVAILGLALGLASCAAKRSARTSSYHDAQMDFSLVHTVAVMPFGNLSGAPPAADRVRDTFMTVLQSQGAVYVVPPGEIGRAIGRLGLQNPATPAPEDVVALCKALSADAVITGVVLEYGEARSASAAANYVSISVKLFEAQTGKVVWSAASTQGGVGAKQRLFGGGGRAMNEVTLDAVTDLVRRLFE